jgi:hypothetical protein
MGALITTLLLLLLLLLFECSLLVENWGFQQTDKQTF